MTERKNKKQRVKIEDLHCIPATQAKNKFGDILHRVCYEKNYLFCDSRNLL